MEWNVLTKMGQIGELQKLSNEIPVLIYKHSTRCSTSQLMLTRLERNWQKNDHEKIKPFFLDLLTYREISNAIASAFQIEHESPQVIVIEKGAVVHSSSHFAIDYQNILKAIRN